LNLFRLVDYILKGYHFYSLLVGIIIIHHKAIQDLLQG